MIYLPTKQIASSLLIVWISVLIQDQSSWSHDGSHANEANRKEPVLVSPEVTYAPTAIPDRIVLTWSSDPATTQSFTWRTDMTVERPIMEFAIAEDGPLFVDKAKSVAATSQPLKSDLGKAQYHSVTLSDLQPETKYVYRVGDGVNWSEWAHFVTASHDSLPFSFVYVGDAQNNLKSHWSRLIRQAYTDAPRAAFTLHAGDLVNRAESDAEWGEWFYSQGFIPRSTPCVAVPGNHEQAKLPVEETGDMTRRLSTHWERVFEFPNNGPPGSQETVFWIDYQGARIVGLNSNNRIQEQASWLDRVLSENPQKWTIVTFHHPIYSSKRGRDNPALKEIWQPIFDKHKVDLVLNGHDHTYARTRLMARESEFAIESEATTDITRNPAAEENVPIGVRARSKTAGTVYVVSVSGPKMYDLGREPYMSRVAEDTQLYQVITVDGNELRYVARTAIGKLYDGFTLRKRAGKVNELIDCVPSTPERTRPAKDATDTQPQKMTLGQVPIAKPSLKLMNPAAQDQDDLCVWRDHRSPERSVIIASDKSADKLFVYDLDGELIQSVDVPMPGNVDLRYDVSLGKRTIDLVAVNQREDGHGLRVFEFDGEKRELISVDQGGIETGPNYGGCLYKSASEDRLYFFSTSKQDGCAQIELIADERGFFTGKEVRHLDVGMSEGAVSDDAMGVVYIAEEDRSVWRFDAEPTGHTEGTQVLSVGDNGLSGDLEGLALTIDNRQIRYLTVSDQGSSTFHVLPMTGGTRTFLFAIANAQESDGIEVAADSFGPRFPRGFFACHSNEEAGCPILITPLPDVLDAIGRR